MGAGIRTNTLVALALAAALVPSAAGSAGAASVPVCGSADVHLHHRGAGAGLGHSGWVLTLVNVSHHDCRVSGYLRVAELASHNVTLLRAAPTLSGYLGGISGKTAPDLYLGPGGTASALLEGLEVQANGDACPTSWGLAVRLPTVSTLVRLRFPVGICGDLQIHPLVAKPTGSQP